MSRWKGKPAPEKPAPEDHPDAASYHEALDLWHTQMAFWEIANGQ